jgi:hypothetical protein
VLLTSDWRAARVVRPSPDSPVRDGGKQDGGLRRRVHDITLEHKIRGAVPISDGALLLNAVSFRYESSHPDYDRLYTVPGATYVEGGTSGGMIAGETFVLSYSTGDARNAAAAPHGDGFLVAWQRQGLRGPEVWSRRISGQGVPEEEARFLGFGDRPAVASQGDVALVCWLKRTGIDAVRVGRNGESLDAAPIEIDRWEESGFGTLDWKIGHVGFDAMQFNIIYYRQRSAQIRAARVRLIGPHDGEARTVLARTPYNGVAAAGAPGSTLVLVSDADVRAVLLNHELTEAAGPRRVANMFGRSPSLAWTGEHYIATWTHQDHLRSARLDRFGQSLDSDFGRALDVRMPLFDGLQYRIVPAGDRLVVATVLGVTVLRDGAASDHQNLPQTHAIDALVLGADGTVLLIHSTEGDWEVRHTYARTVMP